MTDEQSAVPREKIEDDLIAEVEAEACDIPPEVIAEVHDSRIEPQAARIAELEAVAEQRYATILDAKSKIAELEAEVARLRSATVGLSHAAADVVAWFDLIRPDLSGPRIHRLRYANAALAAINTGGADGE